MILIKFGPEVTHGFIPTARFKSHVSKNISSNFISIQMNKL